MDRRAVLAALTPLLAGCFGGGVASRSPEGESTPDAATTGTTPASTETPDPTDTPESTETSGTDSTAEARATEHVETARDHIGTAVETYAGSGDLADVGADAEGFVPGDVYASLFEANSAISRAAALAATDGQEGTVARLEGVVAFLARATTAQANVIEGYDALVAAGRALADGADARRSEMDAAREPAERALSGLTNDADADDTGAVAVLDADDYRAKRDQFDAATTVLDDAGSAVGTFADGLELLSVARTRGENGDGAAAAEDAADAQSRLEDAASTFEGLADDLPDVAGAFEEPLTALADLADERTTAAADVRATHE